MDRDNGFTIACYGARYWNSAYGSKLHIFREKGMWFYWSAGLRSFRKATEDMQRFI